MSEDKTLVNTARQCPMCKSMFGSNLAVCPEDGTLLMPVKVDALIGTLFADKYRITEEIGRGGMSIVYKGVHELMRRQVAIKIMQHELSNDPVSVRRFQQESEAASRLKHQHVITVYDFGVTQNCQPYLILEMVSGIDFAEVLKKSGPLPPERAIKIFRQICDALSHAHNEKVVHRDLKPSNIMLLDSESEPDFVKVLDFGIAKLLTTTEEETGNLTTSGEVFGSPLYMSPEQCQGTPSDQRTDVYAVGIMLYEALCGKPPLRGLTYLDTLQMQVSTPPRPFSTVNPKIKVPAELEAIVFKAIEKKPEKRYQSMKEMSAALQDAGRALGFEQSPGSVSQGQTAAKNSKAAVLLLVGLMILSLGCLTYFLMRTPPPSANLQDQPAAKELEQGTLFYYAPDADPGYLILHRDDDSLKIFTGKSRLENLLKDPDKVVHNGDIWQIAFRRKDNKATLDEDGSKFSNDSDKDIRAVDDLIRNHYANMAAGKFDQAWQDFSELFVQKLNSKEEVLNSWKKWRGVENCDKAPASAIKFVTQTGFGIQAQIDGSKFVKGESKVYDAAFTKEKGHWKFQSLSLESKK